MRRQVPSTSADTAPSNRVSYPERVPSRSQLVRTISPAPCDTVSPAQRTASIPVRFLPERVTTSQFAPPVPAASIATTAHWLPNLSAISPRSSGRETAAVLTAILSAPASRSASASAAERTPPPTVSGMPSTLRTARHRVASIAPALRCRGDIEHHEFIGALPLVGCGEFHGIAGVPQPLEADALDDAARVDIETGNDPCSQHGTQSQRRMSASPQEPESSGWNWQQTRAPFSSAATNGPP